ncbi:MAG: chloride channel protein [Geminicoccaceae bacterium]|nr:chloride channel protein [Geminicoccaceae bacterium]
MQGGKAARPKPPAPVGGGGLFRHTVLHRREMVLGALAVLVGAAAAYAAIGFREGADLIAWTVYGAAEEKVPAAIRDAAAWHMLLVPALGGLALGLLGAYVLPGPQPEGVADVIEASTLRNGRLDFGPMWSGAFFSVASIGLGASVGREGPIVHLSASLASLAGRRIGLGPSLIRTLIGCAVAAGVAASFNAPLAGVFFALEVVVGHYGIGAFSPVVIASVVGTIVTRVHVGADPAFDLPAQHIASFWEFPAFVLLGFVCAGAAIALVRGIALTQDFHRRLKVPRWLQPAIGGLGLGALAYAYPQILGIGYQVTSEALSNGVGLRVLVLVALAKLAGTALCLGSGFGGGIFSPSLAVGALTGGAFGLVAAHLFPGLSSASSVYAVLGMGAVAASTLGAPISTVIMIFELTQNYEITFAVMVSVAIASLVFRNLFAESFFLWQLRRRGVSVEGQRELGLLRQRRVSELMQGGYDAVPADAGLDVLKAHLRAHPTTGLYVVDGEGGLVGEIGVGDLAEAVLADDPAEVRAEGLARKLPVVLRPGDDLADAFTRCQALQEENVPVVRGEADMRLVGEVRFADLMRAYNTALLEARATEQGRRWRKPSP